MSKHTPGPCAEINAFGFWVPVIYFPERAEVGNAKTNKGVAEEMFISNLLPIFVV